MSTHIEWTDETWNPTVGCSPVSEGCRHCYAAKEAIRLAGNPNPKIGPLYAGTAEMRGTGTGRRAVFTGVVREAPDRITLPLRWRKPRRVFVNSMSDLFHESLEEEFIDRVFAIMALTPWHTYQVLTKRPERMRDYLLDRTARIKGVCAFADDLLLSGLVHSELAHPIGPIPESAFRNVWLGVSVEDQEQADARIPLLLDTPAAVRFVSYEPALGPISLCGYVSEPRGLVPGGEPIQGYPKRTVLDWVIIGGESGAGARPFDVHWARDTVAACRAADVAVFVKQLGAHPCFRLEDEQRLGNVMPGFHHSHGDLLCKKLENKKGGDWSEWPADLRVREFPKL